MKTNIFNKIPFALRRKVAGIGVSMYSLSGDLKITIKPFIQEIWRIARICFKGDISNRIRMFNNFFQSLRKIEKNHGISYTIKYLKACQVSIQRVIAKSPYRSLRELEPGLPFPRLYSGLPSLIPLTDRRLIRSGHKGVIRYWLTLFGIYRVLKGPVKSKLDSITDPYSGDSQIVSEFNSFCTSNFWLLLRSLKFKPELVKTEASSIVFNTSSGPNNSFAVGSVLTDLWWFANNSEGYSNFQRYANLTDSHLAYKMDRLLKQSIKWVSMGATLPIKGRFLVDGSICENITKEVIGEKFFYNSPYAIDQSNDGLRALSGGQLSFKEEAAGKLRTFAMVDIWTQSILQPLHKSIYLLLKDYIPNDGTSNQEASFKRVLEKSMISKCAWSVDLSSATDRLPISIQSHIVSLFTKIDGLGDAWKELLVNRDYLISGDPKKLKLYGLQLSKVRYAVGQPMGALSSFAMLGLTHHMIVQFAVHIALGPQTKWFSDYEIVGDDIVLFNEKVYSEYLNLLSRLGVPANRSKSIPAPFAPSAEFLKRTALDGQDVSPISWKELLQGNNLPGKTNLLLRLIDRSLITNTASIEAVICRYGSDLGKRLTAFPKHSLVSVISSIFSRKFSTLFPSLCILLDPKTNSRGEIDYNNIDIPQNQVMKMIVSLNEINSVKDISKFISSYDLREHHVQRGLATMISKGAMKAAYELILEVKANRKQLLLDMADLLINLDSMDVTSKKDIHPTFDLFKGIDIRSIAPRNEVLKLAEWILIDPNDDLEKRISILESKHMKAPLRGIPFDQAMKLLDETVEYASKFSLEKTRYGIIPSDNKVSIMAIKAQRQLTPAWTSFLDFHVNYQQSITAKS